MGCEIFFDSYEIFKGKRPLTGLPASFGTEDEVETLEITCKDPVLDLVVVLSYSVFTKENVITRSVRVKNEGSEALKVEKIYSACLDMDNEDFEMLSLHGSWGRERHIQQGALRYGKQLVPPERRVQPSGAPVCGPGDTGNGSGARRGLRNALRIFRQLYRTGGKMPV